MLELFAPAPLIAVVDGIGLLLFVVLCFMFAPVACGEAKTLCASRDREVSSLQPSAFPLLAGREPKMVFEHNRAHI